MLHASHLLLVSGYTLGCVIVWQRSFVPWIFAWMDKSSTNFVVYCIALLYDTLRPHLYSTMKYCIPRVVPPPGSLYRLVGDPYKPSFPTVTGRGHNPMHTLFVGKETTSISSMLHHAPSHLHLLCRHIPNVNALVGWGHLIGHFLIFRVLHLVEPILKQTTATYQKIDTTMLYNSTTFSYFSHIYISRFSGKTKRFTNTGVGTSSKSPECFTKTVPERTALDSPKINSFFFPESHVSTGGLYGLKQEEHETNKHYRSLHVIPICYRCLDYPLSWYSFSKIKTLLYSCS